MKLKTLFSVLLICFLATNMADAQKPFKRELKNGIKTMTRLEAQQQSAKQQDAKQESFQKNNVIKKKEAPEKFVTVPFSHLLGKETDESLAICNMYTVLDVNGDGKSWKMGGFSKYSPCLAPADGQEKADDWAISPAIQLHAGTIYQLSYEDAHGTTSGKNGRMEVKMGKACTAEAMTTTLVEDHQIPEGNKVNLREATFQVEEDGYYYVGFHCTSIKAEDPKIIRISNFSITESESKIDPPARGDCTYEPYPNGEMKAKVRYTAASKTKTGKDITEPFWAAVVLNWTEKDTLRNLIPGETREFDMPLIKGSNNRIEITPYIGDTPGDSTLVPSFYAGPDCPLPPTNAKAVLSDDGKKVTLTWDPVTSSIGENGGYVDLSKINYAIFDAYGAITDKALALTSECTYTFDYSDANDQDFVAYEITAYVDDVYVSAPYQCYSNVVVIGEPYELPWKESFADAEYYQIWGISMGSTSSKVMAGTLYDDDLETISSQDGDNGYFIILPTEKDAKYGIFSGKINVSKASKPVFEFYYQGQGNVLDAQIAKNGNEFVTAKSIDLKANSTKGWTLCQIPLDEYKTSKYIQVQLFVTARDNKDGDESSTFSVPLDNIRIRDLDKNDVSLTRVVAPSTVNASSRLNVTARIENISEKAASAKVTLYRGVKAVATTDVKEIAANGFASVEVSDSISLADAEQIKYRIEVTSDNDDYTNNNAASFAINVKFPDYPMVEDFSASLSGTTAKLKWSPVVLSDNIKPFARTEDFENSDYTPFTISDFGGWTMYDGDKATTYSIIKIPNDQYLNKAKAWQLFNFDKSGLAEDYRIDFQGPDNSSCVLVAYSPEGKADDWLISPELSGYKQTISFYAKAFSTSYGNEFFEVLYSTTGNNINDFVKVNTVEGYDSTIGLGEEWVECKAALPENAKYFAIRYVSNNNWAMFLDNISFEASGDMPADAEVLGYNVMRNGKVVNTQPITTNYYDDELTETNDYEYRVNVVYNIGESRYCKPLEIEFEMPDAIREIKNQKQDEDAYSLEGMKIQNTNNYRGVYIKGKKKFIVNK